MSNDSAQKTYPKGAVFITGAAVRVGKTIALHLAEKGWNVAVHYGTSKDEAKATVAQIEALGVHAVSVQGDLRDEKRVAHLIAEAGETLGPITTLINNAARFEKDNLSNFTHEGFDAHMAINLRAPLILSKAFAEQLPETASGAIVNVLDACEGMCLSPNFLTYSLSKYGLRDATLLLAKDLAPRIRVNAVSPALTLPKSGEEEMFERLRAKMPDPDASTPEHVAKAVAHFLTTEEITGKILPLDGTAKLPII